MAFELSDRLTMAAVNAMAGGEPGTFKLVWGTYIGNGGQGQLNSTSLTLPGVPLYLMVWGGISSTGDVYSAFYRQSKFDVPYTNVDVYLRWDGSTVSWFSTSVQNQLNVSQSTYHYIALIRM